MRRSEWNKELPTGNYTRLCTNLLFYGYVWRQSRTWGMAFHVVGQSLVRACLERLGLRECRLGGYSLRRVVFTEPRPCPSDAERRPALVFIASPCNHLYLGPAAVDELARQVRLPVRLR